VPRWLRTAGPGRLMQLLREIREATMVESNCWVCVCAVKAQQCTLLQDAVAAKPSSGTGGCTTAACGSMLAEM